MMIRSFQISKTTCIIWGVSGHQNILHTVKNNYLPEYRQDNSGAFPEIIILDTNLIERCSGASTLLYLIYDLLIKRHRGFRTSNYFNSLEKRVCIKMIIFRTTDKIIWGRFSGR